MSTISLIIVIGCAIAICIAALDEPEAWD